MAGKIFLKLIVAVVIVLAVALTAVDFLASKVAENTYMDTLRRELLEKGRIIATAADPNGADFQRLASLGSVRLTLIARDGRVLSESEADPARMENHAGRREVANALHGQESCFVRQSPTLNVPFLYCAIPAQAGALRLAVPLSKIRAQVDVIRKQVLASTAIAFLPSVLLAAFFARYFSERLGEIIGYAGRLARGDFRARLARVGTDELGTLAAQLNETGSKLQGMFEELEREHSELDRLEQVRKDFVMNVSHELRTPLASIQGYTETLLDGALQDPDNNVRFLEIIRQNAERLARLTEDLLTLSRIELKRQRFQFGHYYVNALLQHQVDVMGPIAQKKNIQLRLDPAPHEAEVFCDSEAMHQIVSNLVDNAIKYTPANGTVTVGARQSGEGEIEIYVRDTGIGIPEGDLPRLFERFYRVDKARSRDLGGTGLGLAIVKHLVRAQGGDVRVESGANQGSTFSFTVPVQDIGLPEIQTAI